MSTPADNDTPTTHEQLPALQLVDAATVADLPRQDLAPGVTYAQLWAEGRSFAGVFRLEPHAVIVEHTHHHHCHHVWTLAGQVSILDRTLAPGSYVYVAPGQPHDLVAGADGATAFYLYLVTSTP